MLSSELKLTDMIDITHLQRLQDAFACIGKNTTVILDAAGTPVTTPTDSFGIYPLIQNMPPEAKTAFFSYEELFEKSKASGETAIVACPFLGLINAAVPIIMDQQFLGCWIIGQMKIEEPSEELLLKTSQDFNLDFEALQDTIRHLPRFTKENFEQLFRFIQALNQTIVQLANAGKTMEKQNLQLQETSQQMDTVTKMLRKFVDSADVGMFVCDFETCEIIMSNEFLSKLLSRPSKDIIGRKCWEFFSSASDGCTYCPRKKLLQSGGAPAPPYHTEEYNPILKKWLRSTHQAIYWIDGRLAYMVTFLDVTPEHTMREELSHLAFYNRQMKLPNGLRLSQDFEELKINGYNNTFFVSFDTTSLRRVNDAYGRETGDELLQTIVAWLHDQVPTATIYRVEGDEFCVSLTNSTEEQAHKLAEVISVRFTNPWPLKVGNTDISIVSGVSISIINAQTAGASDDILNLIERTLDVSRKINKIAIYNEDMDRETKHHIMLDLSLKNCITNNMEGFEVHYQPLVNPSAGTWQGLEALCRWNSPDLGPVPPLRFIHEAELLGLIVPLGIWVLETAISQCKQWKLDTIDGFFLSVNLSPIQIMDDSLVEKIAALLQKYDYPGNKLDLEVTESAELYFKNYTILTIERLRQYGIHIALDDFGTGYSSFNNLKNLPVTFLKTERAFIEGIEHDRFTQYLFYILAELAHSSNMRLIAEGVENQQQLEIVLKSGADFVQGYYFSKPLPAQQLENNLFNFYRVNPSFYALSHPKLEAGQLFNIQPTYFVTPGLFKIMNQCMQVLLAYTQPNAALDEVLSLVGNHFKVGRVYLMQQVEGTVFTNTHEWCADGVASEMARLTNIDFAFISENLLPTLEKDGMIVASDTATLPNDIYQLMILQDVQAVAIFPIFDGEKVVGLVGLDSLRFHDWLPEEVLMLGNLSIIMGSSIKRWNLHQKDATDKSLLQNLINGMALGITVINLQDDTILWASKTLTSYWGKGDLTGQKYSQLALELFGDSSISAYHSHDARPEQRHIVQILHSPRLNRTFKVYDSLVSWLDGRIVNLQYIVDVTDLLPPPEL